MNTILMLGCAEAANVMDPEGAVREELAKQAGPVWQIRYKTPGPVVGAFGGGMRNGNGDAPIELGTRKEAVARCGLGEEEVFAAVVYAADNRVGPWVVDVLEAPSEAVGDCIARILEMAPWDREYPRGSAIVLGLRTTGALVAAWRPEDPRGAECTRVSRWLGFSKMSWTMPMEGYVARLSCPSDEPIVRVDIEIVGGVPTVRTAPEVPCVAERAEQMTPDILAVFDKTAVDPSYQSIRCNLIVPMEAR